LIAVVEDPDGYKFALIQRGPTKDPFSLVSLKVGDLDRGISFYEKVIEELFLCG
jgi:lactoylglutathione lyase